MNGLYDEIKIALYSVWSRRWLALGVAWLICILGWIAVSLQPPSYESEARVYVKTQNISSSQQGNSTNEQRKKIEQLSNTILSYENLQKVVRGTNLGLSVVTDKEMDGAVEALRTKTEVELEEDSFYDISVTQSDPVLARDIVQKLIDIMQEENIAGDRSTIAEKISFWDEEVAKNQKILSDVEQRRIKFEQENLGLLPGVGSVSQRIESARNELNQIDTQLISAQSALVALNAQLASESPTINTPTFNPVTGGGGASSALASARGALAEARSRGLTDRHPDVVSLQKQIAALRSQAAAEPRASSGRSVIRTPNPAYSQLQSLRAERSATVAGLRTRKAALQSELAQLSSRQSLEPGVASEMEAINREFDSAKVQYDNALAERRAVEFDDNVESKTDAVKFSIIDKPSLSSVPSAPNRPLLLTIVLFFGLGAGVAVAFAMGHLQTSFPTASRLERASGLPVIGTVSLMLTPEQKTVRTKNLKLLIGGTASLMGAFALLLIVEFTQRGLVTAAGA